MDEVFYIKVESIHSLDINISAAVNDSQIPPRSAPVNR